MEFSIKDFFSKCGQIRRKLRIWSNLLKKSLMENFIFPTVKLFSRGDIHNDAMVFNTVPRIGFKIPPPCWIKGFFFLEVIFLLFPNVLNTFCFLCKDSLQLSCYRDSLVNDIGNAIRAESIAWIMLDLLILTRPFFVKPNTCVTIWNYQIVLASGLSCWRSHCYHMNEK